ncbi:hypothetical protein GMOD_00004967 [Pyrenophora seminiperda CCB06]|uniref:Uncharacterized protein n=1 Tax=Pyrenophora seminiperda CCB06 TaxID=1302712 RepID=A0A3M7MIC6_9PLEO|nr:hypothetical protein GMOD_00004967 [Pyrenophora seminiperda CCB06]
MASSAARQPRQLYNSRFYRLLRRQSHPFSPLSPLFNSQFTAVRCGTFLAAFAQLYNRTQLQLAAIARAHERHETRLLQQLLGGVELYNEAGAHIKEFSSYRRVANGCRRSSKTLQQLPTITR